MDDAKKADILRTIIERLKDDAEGARAQRDRFAKKLESIMDKAQVRGWGKDTAEWPGDAGSSYDEIKFYVEKFDVLAD